MTPIRRLLLCAIVPTVLGLCAGPGAAAGSLLPGCGGPGDSALNQYCESTPTAGGPHRPAPGDRTIGDAPTPALLRAVHRAIPNAAALKRVGPRLHPLVSLPSPPAAGRTGSGGPVGDTGPSVLDLALVMLALTILAGLVGWAIRRTRPGAAAAPPA